MNNPPFEHPTNPIDLVVDVLSRQIFVDQILSDLDKFLRPKLIGWRYTVELAESLTNMMRQFVLSAIAPIISEVVPLGVLEVGND